MRKSLLVLSILGFAIDFSFGLGSGGIGNEVVTAKTLALGGSIMVENDPGNVYLNPSLLGDMGQFNNTVGLSYYNYSAKRAGSVGSDKMETQKIVSPNFFLSHSLANNRLGIGVGFLSPYGLQTEWSDTSNVRYVATKSEIKMFDVTPAISYRFSDRIALGIGADYFSTFSASLQKKVPVDVLNFLIGFPTLGSPDANSKLEGDGNQWGYHTSVTITPTDKHSIGITYHNEVKTRIEGTLELSGLSGASASVFGGTDFKTEVKTDLFYPQNVQLGYRFSPNEKWRLHINTAWYDWSSNKQLELILPNATGTQRSIVGAPIPLQWKDVWSFSFGSEHSLNENWALAGGAFYESAVYPEGTFSPAVPDLDRYGLSLGAICKTERLKLDFLYNPILLNKNSITNTLGQTSAGLSQADISGDYEGFVHLLQLNASVHF